MAKMTYLERFFYYRSQAIIYPEYRPRLRRIAAEIIAGTYNFVM